MGFVASEIVALAGVVICAAAVSPYRATRKLVRSMVGTEHYVEVYVDTPLEICEQRDSKGLYARSRRDRGLHGRQRSLRRRFTPNFGWTRSPIRRK